MDLAGIDRRRPGVAPKSRREELVRSQPVHTLCEQQRWGRSRVIAQRRAEHGGIGLARDQVAEGHCGLERRPADPDEPESWKLRNRAGSTELQDLAMCGAARAREVPGLHVHVTGEPVDRPEIEQVPVRLAL